VNGVDVEWSNSRYTMDNGEYTAPHICWETIITTPLTDNVRVMWLSDSTDSTNNIYKWINSSNKTINSRSYN